MKKIFIIIFWIAIWEIISLLVNNPILMAGPYETVKAIINMFGKTGFYRSVWNSFFNITCGILMGIVLGTLLSSISVKYGLFEDLMDPFVKVLRSIPMVSFVVIVLLWCGNSRISMIISALVTFPIIYLSLLQGLKGIDAKMVEMASVFKMKPLNKIRYIYMPGLRASIESALMLSVGMGWRSGAAAEVIGQPVLTMGNGLYRSKIFLETDRLFAWTVIIILVAALSEKMFKFLIGLLNGSDSKKYKENI